MYLLLVLQQQLLATPGAVVPLVYYPFWFVPCSNRLWGSNILFIVHYYVHTTLIY